MYFCRLELNMQIKIIYNQFQDISMQQQYQFKDLQNQNLQQENRDVDYFFYRYRPPNFIQVFNEKFRIKQKQVNKVYLKSPFEFKQIEISSVKQLFEYIQNRYKISQNTYRLCYGKLILNKNTKKSLNKLNITNDSLIYCQLKLKILNKNAILIPEQYTFYKQISKKIYFNNYQSLKNILEPDFTKPINIFNNLNQQFNSKNFNGSAQQNEEIWLTAPLTIIDTKNLGSYSKLIHLIIAQQSQIKLDFIFTDIMQLAQIQPQIKKKQYYFIYNCNILQFTPQYFYILPFQCQIQLVQANQGVNFLKLALLLKNTPSLTLVQALSHLSTKNQVRQQIFNSLFPLYKHYIMIGQQFLRRTVTALILLFQTKLIYKKLIQDFDNKKYNQWLPILKIIYQKFYKIQRFYIGCGFRPLVNYIWPYQFKVSTIFVEQNFSYFYADKKFVQQLIKKGNSPGTFLQIQSFSSRQVMNPHQKKEYVYAILPFTYYRVDYIYRQYKIEGSPHNHTYVKLTQLPSPRLGPHLLWVDDIPTGNKANIQYLRWQSDLFLMLARQSQEALFLIKNFKWYLQNPLSNHFKVITDIVRIKRFKKYNWQNVQKQQIQDFYAGIDFVEVMYENMNYKSKCAIYCGNLNSAIQNLQKRLLDTKNKQYPYFITSSDQTIAKFIKQNQIVLKGKNFNNQQYYGYQNIFNKCYMCRTKITESLDKSIFICKNCYDL